VEGLITKRYIRLFLLLLGLVVVVSQVAKGCTAAARQAAENCTVARVQVQRVFKGSTTVE
jgi:hypothetical protein